MEDKFFHDACKFLLEWTTRTQTLQVQGGNKLEMVKRIKGYALSCMTHCEDQPSQLDNDVSSLQRSTHAAFVAVRDMLKRLLKGADASLFEALLNDEVSAKDCEAVIPANMLSLAHVLQLDWSQELEDLKTAEADLVSLLTKVEKFQSAHGVLHFEGINGHSPAHVHATVTAVRTPRATARSRQVS